MPANVRAHFKEESRRAFLTLPTALCRANDTDTIVLSGGVFQNELLLEDLKSLLDSTRIQVWTNHAVPANDGGISLGQAALAAFGQFDPVASTSSKEAASL